MVKETRPVTLTSSGSALAEGRWPTYTFPFPFFFHQLQEPLLGIVVPGPTRIHPSPNPPRQIQERESRRQGRVGRAPFDLIWKAGL